ncbi:MAG: cell division topological specificity factor MinE [Lachnospiraceae bacterium]|nr:cell division topological specificity factor MinE [Lachnospiraceae bacterium]
MRFIDLFRKKNTSEIAKDRLKMVLVSDRSAVNPEIMERIKNDIIQVLAKYVEIDQEGLDIKITQVDAEGEDRAKGSTVPALYANIPIKSMKQSN